MKKEEQAIERDLIRELKTGTSQTNPP